MYGSRLDTTKSDPRSLFWMLTRSRSGVHSDSPRLAQPRFFLRRRARLGQAVREIHDLLRKWARGNLPWALPDAACTRPPRRSFIHCAVREIGRTIVQRMISTVTKNDEQHLRDHVPHRSRQMRSLCASM